MRECRSLRWWWGVCVEGGCHEACVLECAGVGGYREKEGG